MSKAVVSLDVGFANTGVAVFQDGIPVMCDHFETAPSDKKRKVRQMDDDSRRVQEMFRQLSKVVQQREIGALVVEKPHGGAQSAKAMAGMARASTIADCLVEAHRLPYVNVIPIDLKKAVGGKKSASKEQIQQGVVHLYGEYKAVQDAQKMAKSKWEHIADALAAYWTARDDSVIRLLESGY